MKLRYARHTDKLAAITEFYTQIIGLEILGKFESHDNYNGVFLGLPNLDWHLEFTESDDAPFHKPDDDDLLVFYLEAQEEMNTIVERAGKFNLSAFKSKNPYWQNRGVELKDPDGFGLILTLEKK